MPRTSSPTTPASRRATTRTAVTDGAALTFETVAAFDGVAAPLRIRPDEATLLRVIDGVVRLTVGNVERLLRAGDEAIVRAGHPHRIAGVSGAARVVMGFRAAPLH
jgi:mannose-6-phosphate isomerase-like protein (cupin superfamily)